MRQVKSPAVSAVCGAILLLMGGLAHAESIGIETDAIESRLEAISRELMAQRALLDRLESAHRQQKERQLSTPRSAIDGMQERASAATLAKQRGAGQPQEAQASWQRALVLDANNSTAAYQLALLHYKRAEFELAQSYMLKLNSGNLASAQSLWLGIRIERQLNRPDAMAALGSQLRLRFAQSRELIAFDKGDFHE